MTVKADRTYTISQLAREFEVTPRALRFYEDKGLLMPRREGMNRVYSHRDRGKLQLILRGKRVGLSLIEIKEILDLYNVDQRAQAQTALKRYKARVVALEAQREDVDAAIEILHDSVTNLQDDEVWLEVEYLGTAGFPLSLFASDRMTDILSTPADQTTSSVAWTTTGLTNPNKQKLAVTFTPQEIGVVRCRVALAKPSYTVYVDPLLTVA